MSDDLNSIRTVETQDSLIRLKHLQDLLNVHNKKRKHLAKKMTEESKLWNNKMKELVKCIEKISYYEKKRERTKRSIKKERHIKNIVRKKRLERLKAMGELREIDRKQYKKEERLHQKLLSRPPRPHPTITRINRKLKDAKMKRDTLGKDVDSSRAKLLEMEAELKTIKTKPLREEIKQIKSDIYAEEVNSQERNISSQNSRINDVTESFEKLTIRPIMEKTKGKNDIINKKHTKRSSDNQNDSIVKKKQTLLNNGKLDSKDSFKTLQNTTKSKDHISQKATVHKKSKRKVLQKKKDPKIHKKSKSHKISMNHGNTHSKINNKHYTQNHVEQIKQAASAKIKEAIKFPQTKEVKLKNIVVTVLEKNDNLNNKSKDKTFDLSTTLKSEHIIIIEESKNGSKQTSNVRTDNEYDLSIKQVEKINRMSRDLQDFKHYGSVNDVLKDAQQIKNKESKDFISIDTKHMESTCAPKQATPKIRNIYINDNYINELYEKPEENPVIYSSESFRNLLSKELQTIKARKKLQPEQRGLLQQKIDSIIHNQLRRVNQLENNPNPSRIHYIN